MHFFKAKINVEIHFCFLPILSPFCLDLTLAKKKKKSYKINVPDGNWLCTRQLKPYWNSDYQISQTSFLAPPSNGIRTTLCLKRHWPPGKLLYIGDRIMCVASHLGGNIFGAPPFKKKSCWGMQRICNLFWKQRLREDFASIFMHVRIQFWLHHHKPTFWEYHTERKETWQKDHIGRPWFTTVHIE